MLQQDTGQTIQQFTVIERALLYARVSRDDRQNDNRNLNGQVEMCRSYANDKGYPIVDELREDDKGASGVDINLPQLSQVREMARNGLFDVLVVRELDRLSRNLAKQLIIEEELNKYGVRVEYVLADYDDTPEGRLNKHIRATIAEYEREKITERMVRGRRNKVKDGHILTYQRRAPYGYRVENVNGKNTLVPDNERAKFVKLIFEWYVYEGLKQGAIADKLDELNAPLPKYGIRQNKRGWLGSTVGKILENEVYIGTWYYGKNNSRAGKQNPREKWIAVSVPAIISETLWSAVKAKKEQNIATSKKNKKFNYLLSGTMKCGHCGLSVVSKYVKNKNGDIRFYYYCGSKSARDVIPRNCELSYFRCEKVDTPVWNWVKSLIMDEEELEKGLADYMNRTAETDAPSYERLEIIDKLLADYSAQFERLLDLYLSGDVPKDLLTDKKMSIETTIAKLEEEKSALQTRIQQRTLTEDEVTNILEFAALIRDELHSVDIENDFGTKQKIIRLLGVRVTLKVENGKRVVYAECKLVDKPQRVDKEPYHQCESSANFRSIILTA